MWFLTKEKERGRGVWRCTLGKVDMTNFGAGEYEVMTEQSKINRGLVRT